MTDLTRVDAALLKYTDFEDSFNNWLSTLVDIINENLNLTQLLMNGYMGVATLVAGTVTVLTPLVHTGDNIVLSVIQFGGNPGTLSYSIVDGVSFTINSLSSPPNTDTSTISWTIISA